MKPGWQTTEMPLSVLCGYGVYQLAVDSPDPIVRAAAWIERTLIAVYNATHRQDLKAHEKPNPPTPAPPDPDQ